MYSETSIERPVPGKRKSAAPSAGQDPKKTKVELDLGEESRWQGFQMNRCR
jgi:hypothetical protein